MPNQYSLELTFLKFTFKQNPFSQTSLTLILKRNDDQTLQLQKTETSLRSGQKTAQLVNLLEPFKINLSESGKQRHIIIIECKYATKTIKQSIKLELGSTLTAKPNHQFLSDFENFELLYKINILGVTNNRQKRKLSANSSSSKSQNLFEAFSRQQESTPDNSQDANKSSKMIKRPPSLKVGTIRQSGSSLEKTKNKKNNEKSTQIQYQKKQSSNSFDTENNVFDHRQALPKKELKKVSELLSTHHRTECQVVGVFTWKIKFVILMLILGFGLLISDGIMDKTQLVKKKKNIKKKKTKSKYQKTNKNKK